MATGFRKFVTETQAVDRLAKSRPVMGILCFAGLAACVSTEPNLSLSSTESEATLDTPVIAVLGETSEQDGAIPAHDPGTSIVYSGIGVPVKAPRSLSGTQQVANAGNASSLALATDAQTPVPAGNVIESSTASTAETQSAEVATQPTSETQAAQNAPTTDVMSQTVASLPEQQAASRSEPKQVGLLARLFGGNSSKTTNLRTRPAQNTLRTSRAAPTARDSRGGEDAVRMASAPRKAKPSVVSARKTVILSRGSSGSTGGGSLPGVKPNSELFGIIEGETGNGANANAGTQLAAVGSFGRLSPNGLRVQHSKVQVACLKPEVLRILKIVERRYGSKPIITSGYRSPKRNRRAGGARNSQHIFCKAVDIQVEGVSKWELAKYLRTIPGRGGVGTYCRTKSVHIDVGSRRDWHHPCRRSKVKKRKKKA